MEIMFDSSPSYSPTTSTYIYCNHWHHRSRQYWIARAWRCTWLCSNLWSFSTSWYFMTLAPCVPHVSHDLNPIDQVPLVSLASTHVPLVGFASQIAQPSHHKHWCVIGQVSMAKSLKGENFLLKWATQWRNTNDFLSKVQRNMDVNLG